MSRKSDKRNRPRGINTTANDFQLRPVNYNQFFNNNTRLQEYDDRRTFHPQHASRPAQTFSNVNHKLRHVGTTNLSMFSPRSVGFVDAKRTLICVRRKIRKEVLHALNKTGRSGQNKPKYNIYSGVRC